MTGFLSIERTFKGEPGATTIRVQFLKPDRPVGYPGVAAHEFRVFFLKNLSSGYRFVSPQFPSVVADRSWVKAFTNPLDGVVGAIGAVLDSPTATPAMKVSSVFGLLKVNTTASVECLRRGLQDGDEEVRLSAAAALLDANDLSALDVAEQALTKPSSHASPDVLHNLRVGIAQGIRDTAAVPVLKRLVADRDAETRRAAITAIAHTRSAMVLPLLLASLDDSDFDVRYIASVGLVEITGEKPILSRDGFRSEEQTLISQWKSWGLQRGIIR